MSKKQTTELSLYRDTSYDPAPIVPTRDKSLVKRESAVRHEDHIQQLIIDLEYSQAARAAHHLQDLQGIAATAFTNGVQSIVDATQDNGLRSAEHQGYLDQYRQRSVSVLARHLDGVLDVSATNIVLEVQRSLYLREEEERKSLMKRLLG